MFIEKQRSSTAEKRKAELQRLTKIQDAVMKPDQKAGGTERLSRCQVAQNLEISKGNQQGNCNFND